MIYKGWKIWFSQRFQVYRAERYGVTMNHKDLEGLGRMIDNRQPGPYYGA